jgi:pilus assembly protein CpaF
VALLQACVQCRRNIIVAGGTGSGKTTLLNALSSWIPPHERVVTIEDTAELRLQQRHVVALEGRPMNAEHRGEISIRDLVRNALRMRPDRIVVGECRGAEALDMLQAMNTGHDGSLTTIHANTPADVVRRLEVMVLQAADMPVAAIRQQIGAAVHLIVQIARTSTGARQITHVSEAREDAESGRIRLLDVMRRRPDGRLAFTGYLPSFINVLASSGALDVERLLS